MSIHSKHFQALLLFTLSSLLSPISQAVTYHAELDPDTLAELAKRPEFASVCRVNGASGVLITPNAILTARHVLRDNLEKNWAKINERSLVIESVTGHPDTDFGIILLKEPVTDIQPTPIYRGNDEVGMTVWKVAFGRWAPLVKGHRDMLKRARVPRAITNNIFNATEHDLHYRYEPKGPGHTKYEGGTAPGDSGGPLYAEIEGKWMVVGVTKGPRKGFYADARISTKAEWIDAILAEVEKQE